MYLSTENSKNFIFVEKRCKSDRRHKQTRRTRAKLDYAANSNQRDDMVERRMFARRCRC
ncbi:MAG: hypothetical protein HQL69_19530 [Magnetococcales bacterium]|nr:hypothetical protein [Magnetococcales bacterium]